MSNNSKQTTRGVAMSFGFRRRPAPSIALNPVAFRPLANIDGNGNDAETDISARNVVPTGCPTPRSTSLKKETNVTRVSKFGFRQTQANRNNKIANLNGSVGYGSTKNGNLLKKSSPVCDKISPSFETENVGMVEFGNPPGVGKFTLQSTNLPRPETIRLIETKTAKTLANNNRRIAGIYKTREENSSKHGSLTEDSRLGNRLSGLVDEYEAIADVGKLEAAAIGAHKRSNTQLRSRNLEIVVTNKSKFNVRDLDDSNDSSDSIPPPTLPQLPSELESSTENKRKPPQSFGLVRERTLEYHRQLDRDNRGRKVSVTSSEVPCNDYGEEEKTYHDTFRTEKTFIKSKPTPQTFLKSRTSKIKEDSSPPSSDEQEWAHGGEAMAEEDTVSLSSSDGSKYNANQEETISIPSAVIGSALQSLINDSLAKSFSTSTTSDLKNILLTIEDPKFAAVAAASNAGNLLDDETLISPIESISFSETEEIKKKFLHSSSESKDINEKATPPSPGSPTNASNSLSLSDVKDDFLIDDEIADQPSLLFEDGVPPLTENVSRNNSEATPTLVESTQNIRRKVPTSFEGSPLSTRNRKFLQSRTGSLDTLSPCESIASDDLMMDYDYSQSSGLDECDRQSNGYSSLNDTELNTTAPREDCIKILKDWNPLNGNYVSSEAPLISHAPKPRLLRSRAGTPNSIPDSPRSLDSRTPWGSRRSITNSYAKSRISHLNSTGYDSDDSVRLDRANHMAMKQDIIGIKTMLLSLRRVLNETETHSPIGNQSILKHEIFNTLCNFDSDSAQEDNEQKAQIELAELRRQILFLQGQLEDKQKTVESLQEQMFKLTNENYHSVSAPASTISSENPMCNAATQTERIRPISAGPSLVNSSSIDGSALVSATEACICQSNAEITATLKRSPYTLGKQHEELPSPHRYTTISMPRKTHSRTGISASTT